MSVKPRGSSLSDTAQAHERCRCRHAQSRPQIPGRTLENVQMPGNAGRNAGIQTKFDSGNLALGEPRSTERKSQPLCRRRLLTLATPPRFSRPTFQAPLTVCLAPGCRLTFTYLRTRLQPATYDRIYPEPGGNVLSSLPHPTCSLKIIDDKLGGCGGISPQNV
jgi:hypothetical protein